MEKIKLNKQINKYKCNCEREKHTETGNNQWSKINLAMIFCNKIYHTCFVYSNPYMNTSHSYHQYKYKINLHIHK